MTESEIMKALECAYLWQTTDVRTYKGMPIEEFSKAVFDLIGSKNKELFEKDLEIEKLQKSKIVCEYRDLFIENGKLVRIDWENALVEAVKAEAIKEFAERVKPIIDEMVDIMWDDDVSKCRKGGCHYPSNIPCGSEMCIEENKVIWKADIDQIAKEMGVEL